MTKRRLKKPFRIFLNLMIVLMSTSLSILLIETIYPLYSDEAEVMEHSEYYYGNLNNKNSDDKVHAQIQRNHSRWVSGGDVIFNVTYDFDEFGRRTLPDKPDAENHIIFMGDSFTMGIGLENDETLPYYVSENVSEQVYNYAKAGSHPGFMLDLLELGNIEDQIEERDGKLFFIYNGFFADRIAITFREQSPYFSYYYLDKNDEPVRTDSLFEVSPFKAITYPILSKSNFISSMGIDFPDVDQEDIYLVYRIIEKSKELYEDKFDGEFYVVFHPLSFRKDNLLNAYLIGLLELNDINYIDVDFDIKDKSLYRIPHDGHPNAKMNRKFAEKLIEHIDE